MVKGMKKLLAFAIIMSFTSSSIVLFTLAGFSVTLFDIVLLLCLIGYVLSQGFSSLKIRVRPIMLVCILALLITILNVVDLAQWLKGLLLTSRIVILIALVLWYSKTDEDVMLFVKAYGLGMLLTILTSYYEIVTGGHLFANYADAYSTSTDGLYQSLLKAPTAMLFNPNNVAVVLAMGMPWISKILPGKLKNSVLVNVVALLITFFVILKTGSRGGILIGAVVMAWTLWSVCKGKRYGKVYLLIGALAVCVEAVVSWDVILNQLQYASFFESGKFALFIGADSSRLSYIILGLEVALRTFFIGCGPWCYEVYTDAYYGHSFPMHFFFVELLACYGIIIFCAFMWLLISSIIKTYRISKHNAEALLYMVVLVAFIPSSVVPPTILTLYTFWAAFGICLAYIKVNKDISKRARRQIV